MSTYQSTQLQRLDKTEAYKLFITAVVPRPIGWVSTVSDEGVHNAAPFSWFNAVCGDPLMVMIAVGRRRGARKDTASNIRQNGEFVVNVATADNAQLMVQSSAEYDASISEFDVLGLTPLQSEMVKPMRIEQSPVHIECTLEHFIELGNQSTDLIIGRCLMLHISDDVLSDDGRIDATRLRPIARLGRDEYAIVDELVRFPRPTV